MLRSILATLLLGIALFLAQKSGQDTWIHPTIWYMLAFFLGVSFLIHRLMEMGFKNNREKFVQFYLSTIIGRLLLSLIFVGVFLYLGVDNRPAFILDFFALYLFYTGFEIFGLYRNLRRNS
ncbi:hypothetical protein [Telluribacter sp.]|jgi:thiol:disulfide interchange protein|uniref:hypothetical protein n=1 Tax=Telluribacter sp. TaxID=1978767 RepID=UPI002E1317A5|nr:hypothetical protein [Telluribacter sp.]